MRIRVKTLFVTAAFCAYGAAVPAAGTAVPSYVEFEVEHLLSFVENSGCEYFRNGFWYGPKDAVAHLRMKYDYLNGFGRIHTAEDFIDLAASKSSISGLPYRIKCNNGPEQMSAPWLRDELLHFRATR